MEMGRLALAGGNVVHVHVEDVGRQESEVGEAGLLAALSQRGGARVVLSVVVPSELQPCVQPPVMVQQDLACGTADHEGAAGDVPGSERVARKTGRLRLDEAEDRLPVPLLACVRREVPEQRVAKSRTS